MSDAKSDPKNPAPIVEPSEVAKEAVKTDEAAQKAADLQNQKVLAEAAKVKEAEEAGQKEMEKQAAAEVKKAEAAVAKAGKASDEDEEEEEEENNAVQKSGQKSVQKPKR